MSISTSLRVIAKSNARSRHELRRRPDALRGNHADLALQLVVDARLPQPWKLCAVREFDHKLGRAEQP